MTREQSLHSIKSGRYASMSVRLVVIRAFSTSVVIDMIRLHYSDF